MKLGSEADNTKSKGITGCSPFITFLNEATGKKTMVMTKNFSGISKGNIIIGLLSQERSKVSPVISLVIIDIRQVIRVIEPVTNVTDQVINVTGLVTNVTGLVSISNFRGSIASDRVMVLNAWEIVSKGRGVSIYPWEKQ